MWLAFKNLIYNAALLGFLLGWIPHVFLFRDVDWPTAWSIQEYIAIAVFSTGALLYFSCLAQCVTKGCGTPLPFDPPKKVLCRGPYAWTRNPMYIAIALMMIAEVIFFAHIGLFLYAVFLVCLLQLTVMIEENALRRRFGALYTDYGNACARWWPRKPRPRLDTLPPFGREA